MDFLEFAKLFGLPIAMLLTAVGAQKMDVWCFTRERDREREIGNARVAVEIERRKEAEGRERKWEGVAMEALGALRPAVQTNERVVDAVRKAATRRRT